MIEQELKPCPFCGQAGGLYFDAGHRVRCTCQDPSSHHVASRKVERGLGAKLWNTRADQCVEVKPLEWEQYSRNGNSKANYAIGYYFAEDHGEHDWVVCLHGDEPILGPFTTLKEAKVAAENHHRETILSQITARLEQNVWNEAIEAAERVADSLFYPDETKISARIRDEISALKKGGE